MSAAQTESVRGITVTEPFRRYAADWSRTTTRTDTPDLMGMFAVATGRLFSPDEERAILTNPDVVASFEAARESLDAWKQSL